MNRVYAVCCAIALASPAIAEPAKVGGSVAEVFGSRFVLDTPTGRYLVDLGRRGPDKLTLKQGDRIEIDGDRREAEKSIRASRITYGDGRTFEVTRKNRTWREFLTGSKSAGTDPTLTAPEAARRAIAAGYAVSGDPRPEKKHYVVSAAKDGKNYDLRVFRDGRLDPQPAFGPGEITKAALAQGYAVAGEPRPEKNHFRADATKDGKSVKIDIHRDGRVVELR